MARRGVRAAVSMLAVVLGVSGPVADGSAESAASAPGTRQPGAFDAVEADLAAERGISLTEARRRIGWQQRAGDLTGEARRKMGGAFGGVWIDPAGGDRVKVGVFAGVANQGVAVAREAAAAAELSEAVDIVPVRYPYAHLETISSWLRDQLASVNAGASWTLRAGLRPDLNAVRLRLPSGGSLTSAQRAVVDTARRQFGSALWVDSYIGGMRAAACDYPFCDPPLRSGIRIESPRGSCTGGFLARSRSDGKLYQFTAGHCAVLLSTGEWVTEFVDGSRHVIGPVHNHRWSTAGDMAILRVNNPDGWDARAWVFVTTGPTTERDTNYYIAADNVSTFGQRVCVTGASFGRTECGGVIDLDATETYNGVTVGGLALTNQCGTVGDSGGPIYAKHTAYGIFAATGMVDGQCRSAYQGIREAEDLMKVNVAHESP